MAWMLTQLVWVRSFEYLCIGNFVLSANERLESCADIWHGMTLAVWCAVYTQSTIHHHREEWSEQLQSILWLSLQWICQDASITNAAAGVWRRRQLSELRHWISCSSNYLFPFREIGMRSRNYFENGNRIEIVIVMKMELGIEIKFVFRMEIVIGFVG